MNEFNLIVNLIPYEPTQLAPRGHRAVFVQVNKGLGEITLTHRAKRIAQCNRNDDGLWTRVLTYERFTKCIVISTNIAILSCALYQLNLFEAIKYATPNLRCPRLSVWDVFS